MTAVLKAAQHWFAKLVTEADNLTPDFLRIMAIVSVLVFLGLAIINWQRFEPQTFGIGLGAVLLAAGGAVRINEGPTQERPKPELP